MSKKVFEQKLADIDNLRRQEVTPATVEALRKALADKNNYAVSKAAAIVEELGINELIPQLLIAFERFFTNPAKTDPQCWAKNAISKALAGLGHDEPEPFLRGLRHVQMEPVWGGQQDTAGPLRGTCALALVQCRNLSDFEVLARLTEALVDPEKTVRVEAARAIGHLGRPEGALLLRLKALVGDREPEVDGSCFSGVFAIEGRPSIEFLARFIEAEDDRAGEAATALGLTREPEAFQILKQRWERGRPSLFSDVLISAIGLTRLSEAIDLLIELLSRNSNYAEAALQALATAHLTEDLQTKISAAVDQSMNPRLRVLFEQKFGRMA